MSCRGLVINKNDINTFFQSFIKPRIFDAEWHISLALDFLNISGEDEFKLDDLCNPEYIKDILDNNKDDEYTKAVLCRKTPEMYISGIFEWYDLYLKNNEVAKMNNEDILKRANDIKKFCALHTVDEENCPFFKGYKKEDNTGVVICELNKGQCSPCNWDI